MNCPENNLKKIKNPGGGGGGGSFRGSKNQKSGKFHELPRKSKTREGGREGGEGEGRGGEGRGGEGITTQSITHAFNH